MSWHCTIIYNIYVTAEIVGVAAMVLSVGREGHVVGAEGIVAPFTFGVVGADIVVTCVALWRVKVHLGVIAAVGSDGKVPYTATIVLLVGYNFVDIFNQFGLSADGHPLGSVMLLEFQFRVFIACIYSVDMQTHCL